MALIGLNSSIDYDFLGVPPFESALFQKDYRCTKNNKTNDNNAALI